MAEVIIVKSLQESINKKFKKESIKIFELIYSLEENPNKGRLLGGVGGLLIKEIKYKSFRFYFIVNGTKIKCIDEENFVKLLLKFVSMSDKKQQQKTIEEIKRTLRLVGPSGFD